MKSCFFMGHREADERLLPGLELEIDRLIREENVRYFYAGGYGGFDRLAAAALKRAKQKYPDITLMLVLPYHPAGRVLSQGKKSAQGQSNNMKTKPGVDQRQASQSS